MKSNFGFLLLTMVGITMQAQYSADLKVEDLMASEVNGIGQKISYPRFENAKVTIKKITFPPGATTGWHMHKIPVFSYIIQGTLTVEIENDDTVQYQEGSCFAESSNIFHRGLNLDAGDLVVLAVYLGGDGQPLSIPKPD